MTRGGRAYKTMLYLGCVAGVYVGAAVAGELGLDESRFSLVTIALLIPAFAGARFWFVVRHLEVYRHEPRRVADRSEGGAGLFGGLVVGVIVSVPVLAVAGLPYWTFWDAASVTMVCGLILTRFGCLMNGCCAGRPTSSRLGVRVPNAVGIRERRYPTQLLEAALATLILAAALSSLREMPFDGALFACVVVSYCTGRVFVQRLREEPAAPLAKSSAWGSSLG